MADVESELRDAVFAAAARDDVRDAVEEIYRELMAAIEIRRPICNTSGRCCRFEEFGHRLYVSTMELAKFVADRSVAEVPVSNAARPSPERVALTVLTTDHGQRATDNPGCPFQIDGLCGIHQIRPFGCRIFFCDETSTQWQHEQYERLHGRLRKLHEQLKVPYYYVEWRFALNALELL